MVPDMKMTKADNTAFQRLLAKVIVDEGGRSSIKMGDAREFVRKLARRLAISTAGDRVETNAFFKYLHKEQDIVNEELTKATKKALAGLK